MPLRLALAFSHRGLPRGPGKALRKRSAGPRPRAGAAPHLWPARPPEQPVDAVEARIGVFPARNVERIGDGLPEAVERPALVLREIGEEGQGEAQGDGPPHRAGAAVVEHFLERAQCLVAQMVHSESRHGRRYGKTRTDREHRIGGIRLAGGTFLDRPEAAAYVARRLS